MLANEKYTTNYTQPQANDSNKLIESIQENNFANVICLWWSISTLFNLSSLLKY